MQGSGTLRGCLLNTRYISKTKHRDFDRNCPVTTAAFNRIISRSRLIYSIVCVQLSGHDGRVRPPCIGQPPYSFYHCRCNCSVLAAEFDRLIYRAAASLVVLPSDLECRRPRAKAKTFHAMVFPENGRPTIMNPCLTTIMS